MVDGVLNRTEDQDGLEPLQKVNLNCSIRGKKSAPVKCSHHRGHGMEERGFVIDTKPDSGLTS